MSYLLTETGDTLLTEQGDLLVTEDHVSLGAFLILAITDEQFRPGSISVSASKTGVIAEESMRTGMIADESLMR